MYMFFRPLFALLWKALTGDPIQAASHEAVLIIYTYGVG